MSDDHKQGADAAEAMPMKLVPTELLGRFRELNPSNYDHDDVCAINAWGVEVCLAAAAPADAGTWAESEAVELAHRAGFAGTMWTMGPEELVHLLNMTNAAPTAPLPAAEEVGHTDWVAAVETRLIAECERAIRQRDEFLRTGASTASHGGSHDTCFGHILRTALTTRPPGEPKP